MRFLETVESARAFLERNGRVSLRALQREFGLDDGALDDLIEELVEIQRVAIQEGRVLTWAGSPPPPSTGAAEPRRDPRDYTPRHLADKILRSKSALEGERKQVTVLFADVKGSMELANQIGPEEWHGILDRFFRILTEGVHRFEGTINQYTGDGIMALFGAPIAHEDHAQRACYAALHLREALHAYGQELRRERGLGFETRIGLNSGEVVVGKIGNDLRMDYTAQGHAVGLAERAQQLAEPGKPCLTEATADIVRGYFQLEDLGEFAPKGVASPVRMYGLEGTGELRTRLDDARARGLSRFVSRRGELTTLELALNRARQGDGQVVGVVGQAGVGKSRLCLQFVAACRAAGVRVLEAHCPAHGETVPLLPMLELLRDAFGIGVEDAEETARKKIAERLLLLDQAFEGMLPLIFELLGVPDPERPPPKMDPETRQRQLHGFLRRWVEALGEREPTVLLFDDIQWIDEGSDVYLAQLVEATHGARILLLANFRPEYRARWMEGSGYQQLPLSPLASEAIDELLQELLGGDPTVAGLHALIRERTAGNPFFIEEVVRSLSESEGLSGSRGSYRLEAPIAELSIPATVQAVLASRIDRLPEREKQVLQAAAVATVVEKRFTESLLASVVGLPGEQLAASLERLSADEFITEEALYPEREYGFRHPLTHAVAYNAQLSTRRSEVHAELARSLAEIHAEKQDEHAASIAHHWEKAGEALEAARWNVRAARRSSETDPVGALRHWRAARSLLAETAATDTSVELEIEVGRGILWLASGQGAPPEEIETAFTRSRTLAEESGDLGSLAVLHILYGSYLGLARNDLEGLARHSREADAVAEQVEDPAVSLTAKIGLGLVSWAEGRAHEAMEIARRALESAPDDPTLGAEYLPFSPRLWLLGFSHYLDGWTGRPAESLSGLEQTQRLSSSVGAISLQPILHLWATLQAEFLGDAAAAMAHARRDLEMAQKHAGPTYEQDGAYYSLGVAHQLDGNSGEAARCLERAIELAAGPGRSPFEVVSAFSRLGVAYADLGESERARENSERGLALVRAVKVPYAVAMALVLHAHVLRRTEGADAREAIEGALVEAEGLVARIGIRSWQPFVHVERAELARLVGDEAMLEHERGEARRLFTEMGSAGHLERLS